MRSLSLTRRIMGLFLLTVLPYNSYANEIWIDINTTEYTLTVMEGDKIQYIFENIAIGRFGTTWYKKTRDDKTPLGDFQIGWINTNSRYHLFFGLNYPDRETAKRAMEENTITRETWLSILAATNREETPPQQTELGGYIGIHGIGHGDPEVHNQFNWTNGCIALTNAQIDLLSRWITPGIMVKIR